jgi:RNA polymerase sigma-70 factor (ECF subfamily)
MPPSPLPRIPRSPPDEAASFDAVCRAHIPQVARWAARLGGPGVDPDEAVQEVFLVVARRLDEFRGDAKLTTWLFRITARVVANQRRATRRRRTWARLTRRMEDEVPADGPATSATFDRRDANRKFYRALDELPERHRRALVLFEIEGLSTEEIARLLARSPATIRVWLHRARARFIVAWRRIQEEGDA